VAMQPGAFVALGNMGQPVCSLDLKHAKYIHAGIVPAT
jgi:hypothetical protein